MEGGRGAHRQCIVWFQNQLGGRILQSYAGAASGFGLRPGAPFIIRVVPGCAGITKRDGVLSLDNKNNLVEQETSATSNFNVSFPSPTFLQDPRPEAANGSGFYLAELPGAVNGSYQLLLNISGRVDQVTITDGDGIEYAE